MNNNQVVLAKETRLSAGDIRANVNLVQEVMRAVMKENTHYGKIPGTPKPTLYKPGAEVLAATFRIAVSYEIEDLSGPDFARYRVTARGTHQTTGIVMGDGMGECSSMEEKYKWRAAVSNKEFEASPVDRRRIKYKRNEEVNQIRTEHADMANTVLKMACKRAQVAMTLNVTAASDIFTQDIEDLPEELRHDDEDDAAQQAQAEALQKKWVDAAAVAKDAEALTGVWSAGLKEIKPTGNMIVYNAFKAAVELRGAAIKKAAEAVAQDPFVAEMEANS